MDRSRSIRRARLRWAAGFSLALLVLGGAAGGSGFDLDALGAHARSLMGAALAWYERTPPADRVTWGGLTATAGLGLWVVLERMARLRRQKVIPDEFRTRFIERLEGGKLDRGKALDYCELNPSPAARVALAVVTRWGRPVTDLERAVSLAHRAEAGLIRKNIGTLRRLSALSPLLGLLGTLHAVSRTLATLGGTAESAAWGPALASALGPLTASVAIAAIGLVAYDGLMLRAEALVSNLDLIGAQTIDAVTMALPTGPPRTPHQMRLEIPSAASPRPSEGSGDFA